MKRYVALARVSSREQEREGFSLAVQEDALKAYATREHGEIIKLFRIAETASKTDERKAFKELIAYAKANAEKLDALLFYKVDRAARNLFDYVELERLESDYGVPFISVSQPTENSPAGRMMRRTLANMASFYTEQQSLDVQEGLQRRVHEGWFIGKAPYGYKNIRINGRSVIQIDAAAAKTVRRIFHVFAYENVTLDDLMQRLKDEGLTYRPSYPYFARSKVHTMLRDRSYIGEVPYRNEWLKGNHEAIIERDTWNRVQTILGHKIYRQNELTYAGGLIVCGHCGHAITGEQVTKKTKAGENRHNYYRCTKYLSKDHPRIRLREVELDEQILKLLESIKIEDEAIREWFGMVLRSKTRDDQEKSKADKQDLFRQSTLIREQQDKLLNLRLLEEIDATIFAKKQRELRDREADIKLRIDAADRSHHEMVDLAVKVFELSQTLRDKWLTANYPEKRQILEILCLNYRLDDVSLYVEMRKPFDVLAKGLNSEKSRGDRIRTYDPLVPNQMR